MQMKLNGEKARSIESHQSKIELTNGDAFLGKVIHLDQDQLKLETWYAGTMQIERPMIKAIYPSSGQKLAIYEGPGSVDDWVQTGNQNQLTDINDGYMNDVNGHTARRQNTRTGPAGMNLNLFRVSIKNLFLFTLMSTRGNRTATRTIIAYVW